MLAVRAGSGILHSSRQTHIQENNCEISHLEELLWQLADEVLIVKSALHRNNFPSLSCGPFGAVGHNGEVQHTLNLRSRNVNGALRISRGNIPERRLLEKSISYRYFKAETSGSVPVKELEFAFVSSVSDSVQLVYKSYFCEIILTVEECDVQKLVQNQVGSQGWAEFVIVEVYMCGFVNTRCDLFWQSQICKAMTYQYQQQPGLHRDAQRKSHQPTGRHRLRQPSSWP